MRHQIRIGPRGEIPRPHGRHGRLIGVRGPGRIATRLACRASVALAMACTAATVARAAGGLAQQVAPSSALAGPLASASGILLVAWLAWATFCLLVAAENWGTAWTSSPAHPVPPRSQNLPPRDVPAESHRLDENCFWAILESSRVVASIKDRDGRYLRVNRHWTSLFDPLGDGVVGKDDFAIFPDELASVFAQNDRIALDAGITVELEEVAPHADGPHTYLSIKVPLLDSWGEARGICSISSDITEREELERRLADQLELARAANAELARRRDELAEANARLAELATTDGLTSLANRRHFDAVIESGVATAFRDGTPLSVLMLDLDGFKSYNDAYGHPAGDMVLQKVGEILRDHVRSCDEVARYGGEEFIAMLPETDEAASRAVAERLRVAIESWCWPGRAITASLGISTFDSGLGDAQALIDRADRALYWSKATGRNRATHHADLGQRIAGVAAGR